MNSYDADQQPEPASWLELDEETQIDLVVRYHRRHHPATPEVRLHATFHTIVENQLALQEPIVVQTLERLRNEGLSRHDAIHAIASVLAAQVYDVLKYDGPDDGQNPNDAYAAELMQLTAESWRRSG